MLRRSVALAGACALVCALSPAVRADAVPVTLAAKAEGEPVASVNRDLVGVGWDRATFTADKMAPLHPNLVRIDAGLERLYPNEPEPGEDPQVDAGALAALVNDVTNAKSIGAEPVVILSYTPAWAAARQQPASDVTKVPPASADLWYDLVHPVVDRLAELGVRNFEAWNEPDLPVFFQGLPSEFLERIFDPAARAVADVDTAHEEIDLRFGGCACFFPDPAWIAPMIRFARDNGLPLDFISWHHYGNTPFLGPDGSEPLGPPEFVQLLDPLHQTNPATSPTIYADQVETVRALRDAMYADATTKPELWIDEWNLSAGGFDLRHDTIAGAAFQAGALVEMQRAGLDKAAVFRSVDPAYGTDVVPASPELYGGWGLVGRAGKIKPAWYAHAFWGELGHDVLAYTSGPDAGAGVSGVLTRDGAGRYIALVSNFHASAEHARTVEIRVDGAGDGPWSVHVVRPENIEQVFTVDGPLAVTVDLGPQDVALVEIVPA